MCYGWKTDKAILITSGNRRSETEKDIKILLHPQEEELFFAHAKQSLSVIIIKLFKSF